MALVLQAVQNIADQAPVAWLSAVDVALVLKCAREAPDSAVRNAALSLLEVLAKKLPDSTLQHVLEVSPFNDHSLLGCQVMVQAGCRMLLSFVDGSATCSAASVHPQSTE